MSFDEWKVSPDISRYHPLSVDIHNQEHTQYQYHNHSHTQEQEHNQEGSAATPPPALSPRDGRGLVLLSDEQYSALIADMGVQEVERCINYVSEYSAMSGRTYKDWSAAVAKCHREGWGKPVPGKGAPKGIQPGVDLQPDAERIRQHNTWIDDFLAEQAKNEQRKGI